MYVGESVLLNYRSVRLWVLLDVCVCVRVSRKYFHFIS